jgi:hypothetical protein
VDFQWVQPAASKGHLEPRYQTWDGKGSLTDFVVAQNIDRRHLTGTQRAVLAEKLEPLYAAEAKERMVEGQKRGGQTAGRGRSKSDSSEEKFPQSKQREAQARDKAAKAAKTNPRYVSDVKKIKHEAPELYAKMETGEVELSEAKQEIREQKKAVIVEQIRQEPEPMPDGPFRVQVIDPPWQYSARASDTTHRSRNPYPDMPLSDIKALPVGAKAHPDGCVLWLWTTNAFMRQAFECLDVWGFENKTILTWVKDRMGTGD